MNSDVVNCVHCCQQCQLYKPEGRKLAGKLQQTEVHRPWEMLGVDIMGPFPRSSNRNVYLWRGGRGSAKSAAGERLRRQR